MKKMILLFFILVTNFSCNEYNRAAEFKFSKIKSKAAEALVFCKNELYNTDFCIIIDLSIHSGKNRFFVWNFSKDSMILSGLCTQGRCDRIPKKIKNNQLYSNVPESHCTSLGKYKIGERGVSTWGVKIKYLLYGLDSSNNNALTRNIVFHSWEKVSDNDIYPLISPLSWGCPAVSNNIFRKVDTLLLNSDKPVLMWIFE